ncbi:hypothetical protein MNBD_GAMMA02-1012 [hydrothermal vent metagenome]|uniref:Uncharacterized protein n=1 Tax=hydrothermal vent metagenome TaxID=652676 RepID=A0A3B0VJE7_9ZZZZ
MYQWFLIGIILLLLSACGSQPTKPRVQPEQRLIAALVAQDRSQIIASQSLAKLKLKNTNIINLYLLAINNKPYQLLSNSQLLLKNYHNYNSAQQNIIKPMLLWAYAHPIYRQETAKQVRLLQRERLLVAPSNINFQACETTNEGCANILREQIAAIITATELTTTLESMAHNDPCINLSDKNLGGEFGNQCLASRKGSLKVNLISQPQYLFNQWENMLNRVE